MRFIDFLKGNRKIFVFAVFALIIVILGIIVSRNKGPKPISQPIKEESLTLEKPNIYPQSGQVNIGGTQNSISLIFDKVVDPKTVSVKAEPSITLTAKWLPDNPTRIILTPSSRWETGVKYRITVDRGAKSLDKSYELKEDIIIEYEVKSAPKPSYTAPI